MSHPLTAINRRILPYREIGIRVFFLENKELNFFLNSEIDEKSSIFLIC